MAMKLDPSDFFNPMLLWTDMGLRALDMTVNSTQSVTEGVDRLTRAGAAVEASEGAASRSAVSHWTASALPSGMALAADLQRSAFDMLMRGWVQWMSAIGNLASMGADITGRALTRANLPLDAVRKVLLLPGGAEKSATQARSGSSAGQHSGRRRESHAESESMEHAFASHESKRRRDSGRGKPKAKARRARNA